MKEIIDKKALGHFLNMKGIIDKKPLEGHFTKNKQFKKDDSISAFVSNFSFPF